MKQCPIYNGIHLSREFTTRELEYIRHIIKTYSCTELFNPIYFMCIIGSPSENAKIYKAIYNNLPVAVKIPNYGSNDNINEEININIRLFNDDLFLRMYGYIECYVSGVEIYTYITKVMFMELAIGDLLQYLKSRITLEKLNEIIVNVFNSVARLAELKIKHNDLHIKNIFMVKRFMNDTAVIGDFGKSIPQQYLVSNADDIYTFFSSLKKYLIELEYFPQFIELINFYIRSIWAPIRNKYEYQTSWIGEDSKNLIIILRDQWIHLIFEKLLFSVEVIMNTNDEHMDIS